MLIRSAVNTATLLLWEDAQRQSATKAACSAWDGRMQCQWNISILLRYAKTAVTTAHTRRVPLPQPYRNSLTAPENYTVHSPLHAP